MQTFTDNRTEHTADEMWVLEHAPVLTLGRAAKTEHVLNPGDIPVIRVDRGGQVTYHGPGQLVIYLMIQLKGQQLGVRSLVDIIENAIIKLLSQYGINAQTKHGAPGVYVDDKKIAALGLRIRRGSSYHGLSLNINMDLEPFSRINPCGYEGMQTTQTSALNGPGTVTEAADGLLDLLTETLEYDRIEYINSLPSG